VEKRDRHDERQRSRSIAKESLRRDIPVPAAKQDLQDAGLSPEIRQKQALVRPGIHGSRRGDGAAFPPLAFGQMREPESRSAVRLPRTRAGCLVDERLASVSPRRSECPISDAMPLAGMRERW
jgi:hypothetical protein